MVGKVKSRCLREGKMKKSQNCRLSNEYICCCSNDFINLFIHYLFVKLFRYHENYGLRRDHQLLIRSELILDQSLRSAAFYFKYPGISSSFDDGVGYHCILLSDSAVCFWVISYTRNGFFTLFRFQVVTNVRYRMYLWSTLRA